RSCVQQLRDDCCPNDLPCCCILSSLNNVLPIPYDEEDARPNLCYQRCSHGTHHHNSSRGLRQPRQRRDSWTDRRTTLPCRGEMVLEIQMVFRPSRPIPGTSLGWLVRSPNDRGLLTEKFRNSLRKSRCAREFSDPRWSPVWRRKRCDTTARYRGPWHRDGHGHSLRSILRVYSDHKQGNARYPQPRRAVVRNAGTMLERRAADSWDL